MAFSTQQKGSVEKNVSDLESTHNGLKLLEIAVVNVNKQYFFVHHFILKAAESCKQRKNEA